MRCPHCNQEHSNQAVFCPVTGNQIVAFECPSCGQVVTAGSAFCPYCGFDLGDEAAAPVSTGPSRLRVVLAATGGVLAVAALAWFVLPRLLGLATGSGGGLPATAAGSPGVPALNQTLTAMAGSPAGAESPTAAASSTTTTITTTTGQASGTPPDCTAVGQTWVRPADNARMVCVPSGSFVIGLKTCDFKGCEKEVNGGSVALDVFWIDEDEVTNTAFDQFVTATGYLTGAERTGYSEVSGILTPVQGADWRHPQGPDSSVTGLGDNPVVQVNWFDAAAYCKWAGASLPSEAQWEKAARGSDGRLFPWGSSMPVGYLLNAADINLPEPWADSGQNDGYRYTAPVGSYPEGNSPYGAEDMAGNVWEWTRSLYKDYPYQANDGREIQTAPASTDKVVLRGGSWFSDYGSVRSTLRATSLPAQAQDALGFRCIYP